MNDWARMERQAKRYKEMYPAGTRIMLDYMDDPYAPIPSGTKGTVDFVDDVGTIHMRWDNGRSLGLVPGEDSFHRLSDKELEEESNSLDDKIQNATNRIKENNTDKGDMENTEPVQEI